LKKENLSEAKVLIGLIGAMLKYESPITPEEAVQTISKGEALILGIE
jgi:hypothetical protein